MKMPKYVCKYIRNISGILTQEDENICSKFLEFFKVVTSMDSHEHTFNSKDACIHRKPMGAVMVKFVERLDFTTSAVILSALSRRAKVFLSPHCLYKFSLIITVLLISGL